MNGRKRDTTMTQSYTCHLAEKYRLSTHVGLSLLDGSLTQEDCLPDARGLATVKRGLPYISQWDGLRFPRNRLSI